MLILDFHPSNFSFSKSILDENVHAKIVSLFAIAIIVSILFFYSENTNKMNEGHGYHMDSLFSRI